MKVKTRGKFCAIWYIGMVKDLLYSVQFSAFFLLVLACSDYTLLTTIQNSETRDATVVLGTKCFPSLVPSLSPHVNEKSKGKGRA